MAPKWTFIGLAFAAAAGFAQADTLIIDGLDMDAPTTASRPTRGTAMATVEARHGTPTRRVPAVGEPPITRWEYPGFTVYFEHNLVLHAVVNR